MWVFRRSILEEMTLESDGMAFSEEIKVEALRNPRIRFGEISIQYSSRLGEIKLNPWRDGIQNLLFLVKKRLSGGPESGKIKVHPPAFHSLVPRKVSFRAQCPA